MKIPVKGYTDSITFLPRPVESTGSQRQAPIAVIHDLLHRNGSDEIGVIV